MYYKKGVRIDSDKSMFEFLKNHFTYDTLNSWNGLKSIAHNVRLYNLQLKGDEAIAQGLLQLDNYAKINMMIEEWNNEHPNYAVGFNGRSDGYLVLYRKDNCRNVLPDYIADNTYEEYKEYCKEYEGGVKYNRYELVELTQLVRSFDKLCDKLRNYVNKLSLRKVNIEKLEKALDNLY